MRIPGLSNRTSSSSGGSSSSSTKTIKPRKIPSELKKLPGKDVATQVQLLRQLVSQTQELCPFLPGVLDALLKVEDEKNDEVIRWFSKSWTKEQFASELRLQEKEGIIKVKQALPPGEFRWYCIDQTRYQRPPKLFRLLCEIDLKLAFDLAKGKQEYLELLFKKNPDYILLITDREKVSVCAFARGVLKVWIEKSTLEDIVNALVAYELHDGSLDDDDLSAGLPSEEEAQLTRKAQAFSRDFTRENPLTLARKRGEEALVVVQALSEHVARGELEAQAKVDRPMTFVLACMVVFWAPLQVDNFPGILHQIRDREDLLETFISSLDAGSLDDAHLDHLNALKQLRKVYKWNKRLGERLYDRKIQSEPPTDLTRLELWQLAVCLRRYQVDSNDSVQMIAAQVICEEPLPQGMKIKKAVEVFLLIHEESYNEIHSLIQGYYESLSQDDKEVFLLSLPKELVPYIVGVAYEKMKNLLRRTYYESLYFGWFEANVKMEGWKEVAPVLLDLLGGDLLLNYQGEDQERYYQELAPALSHERIGQLVLKQLENQKALQHILAHLNEDQSRTFVAACANVTLRKNLERLVAAMTVFQWELYITGKLDSQRIRELQELLVQLDSYPNPTESTKRKLFTFWRRFYKQCDDAFAVRSLVGMLRFDAEATVLEGPKKVPRELDRFALACADPTFCKRLDLPMLDQERAFRALPFLMLYVETSLLLRIGSRIPISYELFARSAKLLPDLKQKDFLQSLENYY